jgi:hypothetical protein
MKRDAEIWTLSFAAESGGVAPMAIRVRRLLKCALRAFGLRCVRVWPAGQQPEKGQQDKPLG